MKEVDEQNKNYIGSSLKLLQEGWKVSWQGVLKNTHKSELKKLPLQFCSLKEHPTFMTTQNKPNPRDTMAGGATERRPVTQRERLWDLVWTIVETFWIAFRSYIKQCAVENVITKRSKETRFKFWRNATMSLKSRSWSNDCSKPHFALLQAKLPVNFQTAIVQQRFCATRKTFWNLSRIKTCQRKVLVQFNLNRTSWQRRCHYKFF